MKKWVLIPAAICMGVSLNALADKKDSFVVDDKGFYLGASGGIQTPEISGTDFDADLGAQLGYRFNNWRFEEGYNYYFSNNVNALMTNAYYDFHNSSKFIPYLGLGAGMTTSPFNFDKINFAYQENLGVDYQLKPNLTLGVNYRYINFGDQSALFYPNYSSANAINLTLNHYF